jgi:hypothetical protein
MLYIIRVTLANHPFDLVHAGAPIHTPRQVVGCVPPPTSVHAKNRKAYMSQTEREIGFNLFL